MGIRERSGEVNSNDKLVGFVYLIMRDHLPSGIVEEIMRMIEEEGETEYSNGWLAKHAQDIVERLRNGPEKAKEDHIEELR